MFSALPNAYGHCAVHAQKQKQKSSNSTFVLLHLSSGKEALTVPLISEVIM